MKPLYDVRKDLTPEQISKLDAIKARYREEKFAYSEYGDSAQEKKLRETEENRWYFLTYARFAVNGHLQDSLWHPERGN